MKSDGNDRQIIIFLDQFWEVSGSCFFLSIRHPKINEQIIVMAARYRQLMIKSFKSLLRPRESLKSLPIKYSDVSRPTGRNFWSSA